jgi:hypothetical protein
VPFTAASLAAAASLALLAVVLDRCAEDFARLEAGVFAAAFLRVVDFDDARPFELRAFDDARPFELRVPPLRAVERPLVVLVFLVVWAIRALLPNPLQNGHTRRRSG